MKDKFLLFFSCLSLTITQYYMARMAVFSGAHLDYKVNTFIGKNMGDEYYRKNIHLPAWRGRIGSNWFAAYFVGMKDIVKDKKISKKNMNEFANKVATWHSIWIFSTFLILAFSREK